MLDIYNIQGFKLFDDFELDKDFVIVWIPAPVGILNSPLGEQAIDLASSVEDFQLFSFIG